MATCLRWSPSLTLLQLGEAPASLWSWEDKQKKMDGYDKTLTEKLEKARMRLQTKRCQTWELAERVRKACKTSVVCFSLPEATLAARNTAHRKLSLNCWWSNCIVGRCSSFGNTHTNPLPNKHSVERDCVFPQSHFCILSLLLWFCPLLLLQTELRFSIIDTDSHADISAEASRYKYMGV